MITPEEISALTPPKDYTVQPLKGGGVAVSLEYESLLSRIGFSAVVGVGAIIALAQGAHLIEPWIIIGVGILVFIVAFIVNKNSTSAVAIYPDRLLTIKSIMDGKIVYGRKEVALSPSSEIELIASDYTERDKKNGIEPFMDTIVIKTGDKKMKVDEWCDQDAVWALELIKRVISTAQ